MEMKSILYTFVFLLFDICSITVLGAQDTSDTILKATPQDDTPVFYENTLENSLDSASQAYRNNDFKKSIEIYEGIVAEGIAEDRESAQIYYNLGNAYFRDSRLGKAILNYERALMLDPGDSDIRHNLRFAGSRTEDRIEEVGSLFLTNWINGIRNMLSSDMWGTAGIVFFLLFLVCLTLFLFVRLLWIRKTAFYSGIVFFVFMIIANIFAFNQKREQIQRTYAIVIVGAASVNASPDENSNVLFELHEGTKVKIRNSDGNWYEIEIANGSVGWTPKQKVEII